MASLLRQKKNRKEAADQSSQQRNVFLALLIDHPAHRAKNRAEKTDERTHEKAETNGVFSEQKGEELRGFFEDFFEGKEDGEAGLDEVGDQCDLGS